MSTTTPFKLLYVCNGNNARSPLAAAFTWDAVSRESGDVPWQITSAGTGAGEGKGVRSEVLRAAAGLVLGAWGRVFTIKEFVHWAKQASVRPPILFADRVEQMRDKVVQAHAVRKRARADHGFWGGLRPAELNLIEPDGHGDVAWNTLALAVQALVNDVITLLPPAI